MRRGAGRRPKAKGGADFGWLLGCSSVKTTEGMHPPIASPARTAAHPAKIRSSAAITGLRLGALECG
jgi:hypothetical protein